jgi:cyanobactin biosynthesis protein (PatB/AcyB/McaB family)
MMPPQYAPVKRPDLVVVHQCVDVIHGTPEQLVAIRLQLTHGANYNDPQAWVGGNYDTMTRQR